MFEDTFLFGDTVAANIAFADPEATQERIEAAANLAGAHEFISELPDGYATELGERGFSLSGGQRQRIALARAILADPRVLILDDATSSVDPTKEHEIRDALKTVMKGRTTIVIAHRTATIALADRVVLLDEGRIVAEGTHLQLLAHKRALPRSAGPGRRRGRLMWNSYAVEDEDRLQKGEAGHLVRRAFRMLRPYRREVILCVPCVLLGWTAGDARRSLRDQVTASTRDSTHHNGAALNRAADRLTRSPPCAVLVLSRAQILLVNRIGESFLRDMRERVFDHLMRMSLGFYDTQQTGKLVARMTSDIDSLQELVQQGLIAFVTSGLLLVVHHRRAACDLAGAGAAVSRLAADRRDREHPVPAVVEPGLPRRARTHRSNAGHVPRRRVGRPRYPGVRSRGGEREALRPPQPGTTRRLRIRREDLGALLPGRRVSG